MQAALREVEALYESQSYVEAIQASQLLIKEKIHALSYSEHGRLYRITGLCARALDKDEAAFAALSRAYRHDPLDRDVLVGFGQLSIANGEVDDALEAFELLLLHHGRSLETEMHRDVLRTIGRHLLDRGEARRALSKLSQAWDVSQDPVTGRLYLDGLVALGDTVAARRLRAAVIELTTDPEQKAQLLTDQADAFEADGHVAAAAELLQQAYTTHPVDAVFARLERFLGEQGRWSSLAEIMEIRLSGLQDDAYVTAAESLVSLYGEKLQQPARAAAHLEDLLDRAPTGLKRFERVTQIHTERQAWPELHDAYARMIQRTQAAQPENKPLLALLWRNVGEVCRTQLGDMASALYAAKMANELQPDPALEDLIVELTEEVGSIDEQVDSLAHALARMPERLDLAERYGAALLRADRKDHAYLVLRTLVASGGGSEQARGIVAQLHNARPALDGKRLSQDLRDRYATLPQAPLDVAFEIAYHLLNDAFEKDIDSYGLSSRKHRVDIDQPLLFNRALKKVAPFLGFDTPPKVWEHEAFIGIQDASFHQPALLIGTQVQSGRSERELLFGIGQRLAMMQPRFAFAGRYLPNQLKLILATLINAVNPDFQIGDTAELNNIKRAVAKGMTPGFRDALTKAVELMFADEAQANVDLWLKAAAAHGNYVGLLCADDVEAALRGVEVFAPTPGPRDTQLQQKILRRWAWSKEYLELRAALGLGIG